MSSLVAPRIYDALAHLGQASAPQLRAHTGISKNGMHLGLAALVAYGTVIEMGRRPSGRGKASMYYRLAAGALRPSETPKPTGFQRRAEQLRGVDAPVEDAAPVGVDDGPTGIVPRALAAALRDPLVRWVRGEAVA